MVIKIIKYINYFYNFIIDRFIYFKDDFFIIDHYFNLKKNT